MSLADWLNEGHLRTHKSSKNEINQLLSVFARDIADAQSPSISIDRRFTTAYNAALTLCIVALAASGYRAAGEGHHYWAIQSLSLTLQLDADTIEKFNKFRRKRNISDYERSGAISTSELTEMLELATHLRVRTEDWLRQYHPELL